MIPEEPVGTGAVGGEDGSSRGERAPAPLDRKAPTFAGTPTAMSAGDLTFKGITSVELVTVPTADGKKVRAVKITADVITATGFALAVRPVDGPILATTADSVRLEGKATMYLSAITATDDSGELVALGVERTPRRHAITGSLSTVAVGLVGMTAESISYDKPEQLVVEDRQR